MEPPKFSIGDPVTKKNSDYYFHGTIVSVFNKMDNGPTRYVVEDDRGTLFIQNESTLVPRKILLQPFFDYEIEVLKKNGEYPLHWYNGQRMGVVIINESGDVGFWPDEGPKGYTDALFHTELAALLRRLTKLVN